MFYMLIEYFMVVFMIPVDSRNMSIDLDYFSLGKSEENELCKEFQVVLGYVRLYISYIMGYI